jgi:hypothetical protein
MLSRDEVIKSIKKLPETFTVDDVIDRVMLLDKIDTGLRQSQEGKVTADEDLDQKLPTWLR